MTKRVMIPSFLLAIGLCSCSDTPSQKQIKDLGNPFEDGVQAHDAKLIPQADGAPPLTMDAAPAQDGQALDQAPAKRDILNCGPGIYPCPPYGALKDNILENLSFGGWADDDFLCKPLKDQLLPVKNGKLDLTKKKEITFGQWHIQARKCATPKQLLWINTGARWCVPCQQEADELSKLFKAGKLDERIAYLAVLFQDDNHLPLKDAADVEKWINEHDLINPIVMDPNFKMGRYFDAGAVPYNLVVNLETMKILVLKKGGANLVGFMEELKGYLK